ncbi:D-alanyl-D-alanine carboxypeptidase/D-alanyl-D-alanine-endopeptidase [Aquitalea sp. ASV11]|uniref:D-alanyl-D-alanine carboxypeptidase/D-alanyl-D-alanine endopeptidase n=1 Tax=Aquitalea sp. ASV11 TaxID=2795103 RepID=UPI0018EC533C|nr:D-alanyl-D-alanine carboxypeptidase/D-alanyl-D-alanine-endopeptidase [Aquitalea sp. ASV11]
MKVFSPVVALALSCHIATAAALDLHGLKPDEVAVWAAPVEGGPELASLRADVPVNPASTMKLLTSWTALNRLGPGYRWTTRLVSAAQVQDGVLKGDLVWVGAGDPRFGMANLRSLLHDLRLRGIRQIDGRLLLDKSAFSSIGTAENFGGDEGKSFTVEPDTHLTGLKVAWLRFFNDSNGTRVVLDPPLAGVSLQARLSNGGDTAGSCPDVRQWVHIREQGSQLEVSGKLPTACDGSQAYVNVLDHNDFAAQSFAALWQELGGSGPQGMALGRAPANARTLAQFQSEPLITALNDINKYSNNTMARTVFLTLGREAATSGDTPADAQTAVRSLLAEQHIAADALVLENGCGLSRRERVSARLLGQVLLNAARGPYGNELMTSLPLASEDGTLKRRFASIGPRLRMKTGTLKDVKALAGYWQAADGRRLAIVAIVNSPRAPAMAGALDAVVADLIHRFDHSAPAPADAIMQP